MVLSKFDRIECSCKDYMHPWDDSCISAAFGMVPPCIKESLRIYVTAYSFSLLLRGKIPDKKEILKTFLGILQSCLFLTLHGFGFPAAVCLVRKYLGHFNFYTVSYIPSFLSSIVSILIERPSRRGLLSLYVTNVASETLFRMAVDRKIFKPVPYGEVFVFATSVASLLYIFKGSGLPKDPIYSILKFLVGKNEEKSFVLDKKETAVCVFKNENDKNIFGQIRVKLINRWRHFVFNLKTLPSHPSCPHQFSCAHYSLHAGTRSFLIGYLIQISLRYVLNIQKIKKNPRLIVEIPFKYQNMTLAIFFSGFSTMFRTVSCTLRHYNDKDSPLYSFPAGFLAGLFFYFYRDNSIALYFMWKTVQIYYNEGVKNGLFYELPWAPVFLHAFSTAILFHVAVVEPQNLRSSYWNFLYAMSGKRIAHIDRKCLDRYGLESSEHLQKVMSKMGKRS